MLVFPALLTKTDANHWVAAIAGNAPLLVALVGAVGAEAANMELQLNALVALCNHLSDFNGLVTDDLDYFVGVDVAVTKVVCEFLVVAAMAVAMITGAKLAAALAAKSVLKFHGSLSKYKIRVLVNAHLFRGGHQGGVAALRAARAHQGAHGSGRNVRHTNGQVGLSIEVFTGL